MSALLLFIGFLQFRPLPALDELLQLTKAQLIEQFDENALLRGYSYRRRTIRDNDVKEHNIFQFDNGGYSKLIRENGVAVHAEDLEKHDSGGLLSPKTVDDMFRVWTFQLVSREIVSGRPTLVVTFEPQKNSRPETRYGKWLFKNSKGVAWIDEEDHRLVRMRIVFINDVSVGWGLVAKLYKGTEWIREWRKSDDEVWLPSMSLTRVKGRAFLVGIDFQEIQQYFDYRKFDGETKLRFDSPK
jgi:hypothetical protein